MNKNFSVSVRSSGNADAVVIVPSGYVNDMGAISLENVCKEYLDKGCKKVVINFSEMQFINSIGASIFTGIVQDAIESNGMLCFTNMRKFHHDVFVMLGITRHVRVFKEEADALVFLKAAV